MASRSNCTYAKRAQGHQSRLVKKLFEIAEQKQTNVVLSADVTSTSSLLDLADRE